ncbi:hypothetical protein RQP46_007419 [Phenoliferia psychrophenolica]
MSTIQSLPDEVLDHVFLLAEQCAVASAARVCKRWNAIATRVLYLHPTLEYDKLLEYDQESSRGSHPVPRSVSLDYLEDIDMAELEEEDVTEFLGSLAGLRELQWKYPNTSGGLTWDNFGLESLKDLKVLDYHCNDLHDIPSSPTTSFQLSSLAMHFREDYGGDQEDNMPVAVFAALFTSSRATLTTLRLDVVLIELGDYDAPEDPQDAYEDIVSLFTIATNPPTIIRHLALAVDSPSPTADRADIITACPALEVLELDLGKKWHMEDTEEIGWSAMDAVNARWIGERLVPLALILPTTIRVIRFVNTNKRLAPYIEAFIAAACNMRLREAYPSMQQLNLV